MYCFLAIFFEHQGFTAVGHSIRPLVSFRRYLTRTTGTNGTTGNDRGGFWMSLCHAESLWLRCIASWRYFSSTRDSQQSGIPSARSFPRKARCGFWASCGLDPGWSGVLSGAFQATYPAHWGSEQWGVPFAIQSSFRCGCGGATSDHILGALLAFVSFLPSWCQTQNNHRPSVAAKILLLASICVLLAN
ncbi:hypothetical protein BDR26DRAFT_76571 [Obelidium mucronatum]|nr:hypothetical protein BDR26DRAFT_76571 [Obelidium mucronatum]